MTGEQSGIFHSIEAGIGRELGGPSSSSGCVSPAIVQSLLEKRAALHNRQPKLTLEEFKAELDGLAEFSDKIPDRPLETFNRESIYRDHD